MRSLPSGSVNSAMFVKLYDPIGTGYSRNRIPDARIAVRISDTLEDSDAVLNVGAGAASYEPMRRFVVAVEPSATMIEQRPAGAAPVVQARAENLPFREGAFDAAMAVLTIHHWSDWRGGIAELTRAARSVVVLTWDPAPDGFWLTQGYFPDILALDRGARSTRATGWSSAETKREAVDWLPPAALGYRTSLRDGSLDTPDHGRIHRGLSPRRSIDPGEDQVDDPRSCAGSEGEAQLSDSGVHTGWRPRLFRRLQEPYRAVSARERGQEAEGRHGAVPGREGEPQISPRRAHPLRPDRAGRRSESEGTPAKDRNEAGHEIAPGIEDLKVYVPAKDFERSKRFYAALGFSMSEGWGDTVDFELNGHRFRLQDYYVADWANNFMIVMGVDDVEARHCHVREIADGGEFPDMRIKPPEPVDDSLVLHVVDPFGVLLVFVQ